MKLALLMLMLAAPLASAAPPAPKFEFGGNPNVRFTPSRPSSKGNAFPLLKDGTPARVIVDDADWPGVARAGKDLQSDLARVGSWKGELGPNAPKILVGTLGKSPTIDRLARSGKIDVGAIRGKWEASVTQIVGDTLVVAGADKRGTIYALYDLSQAVGVSPWNWWADVPVKPHREAYITGRYVARSPVVKYRGIFLNDEAPALTNWANEKFGGFNHTFYEHVFELLLRLRANYLWPAMWNNAFSEDDPLNPQRADEYGIVMGTSHVEPMMRADKEWNRLGFAERQWNYATNSKELETFWTDGVNRNKPYENIVTMAMRGKIDTPMSETANIALLERIVAAQRKILAENVNLDVAQIPQLWCLYKEVQEYYEKGMRVPEDITLLWADDNWGDIRRLPTLEERARAGGAGVYYHFDYVGGPRNYKWIDTNPISKVWEQMNLAHQYAADRIWIVNVGDLKPMEFPLEFFMTMARDPERMRAGDLDEYALRWAAREFGDVHAAEIAEIVMETHRLNGRRKPELITPTTYSLDSYREAERIEARWASLLARAEAIDHELGPECHSAFFQLVLHPVKAAGNLQAMYIAAGRNARYAAQGRASANDEAAKVRALFARDAEITKEYHSLNGGKWNHFMDQTHIGYTGWQQPDVNAMPKLAEVVPERGARMAIDIEATPAPIPATATKWLAFDRYGPPSRYFEICNLGDRPFDFKITGAKPWMKLSRSAGRVEKDVRIEVAIDWSKAPAGSDDASLVIDGPPASQIVNVRANNRSGPLTGFVEGDGVIAIEPEHSSRRIGPKRGGGAWVTIPGYGRTLSGVTPAPYEFTPFAPGEGPCLEYDVTTFSGGKAVLHAVTSPSLAFAPGRPLRFAVAIDGEAPQVVQAATDYLSPSWERSVENNARDLATEHDLKPGRHTIKIWAIDPGVVLQRLILDLGGLRPSYLGPPESLRAGNK